MHRQYAEPVRPILTDGLNPQLAAYKGWRVEVITDYGETRRFIVGQSTGWAPCYLEIARRDSSGGGAAESHYASVKPLYRILRPATARKART